MESEQTIQLADYIQRCLDQGIGNQEISSKLLQRGWMQEAIDDAYRHLQQLHLSQDDEITVSHVSAEPEAAVEIAVEAHPVRSAITWIVAPIVLLGIVVGLGFIERMVKINSSLINNATILAVFVCAGLIPFCLIIGIIKLIRR